MRIYPTINLPLFYNNGIDYDSRPTRVELGKGGVIDRSRTHWQNATKRSFNISATLKDRDELNTFLEANRGLPFEFRAEGIDPPGLFVCNSWTWKWIVYVDGIGVWSLSAKFEEVFRPGYVFTDAGAGNIKLPKLLVSGVGSIIGVSPVGSGTLTFPALNISGSGVENKTVSGSGTINVPSLNISGSGSLDVSISGSGDLTIPALTLASTAQLNLVGSGAMQLSALGVSGSGNVATAPQAETTALLAAFSGTYNSTRQANIDTMIAALKAGGYWSNIVFMIWPGANTADSFINWKSPGTLDATNVGFTVTPFSCYQGDGSTQYISSNVVPSSHLSQNSHTLSHGCWTNEYRVQNAYGGGGGSNFASFSHIHINSPSSPRPEIGLSTVPFSVNVTSGGITQIGGLTNDGIWLQTRRGAGDVNSTDWLATRNKVSLLSTVASSSQTIQSWPIVLGCASRSGFRDNFSLAKYSFWMFANQGYAKSDLDAMTDIFQAYQDTLTPP